MSSETREIKDLLEKLYVSQVLIIANQIKAEKAAKGSWSSDGCIQDAINELRAKSPDIIIRIARSL